MVNKLLGRAEDYLLPIVQLVVFLLLCSSVTFLPAYPDYNPDEANIIVAIEELGSGWFQPPSWVLDTHLIGQIDYWILAQFGTPTIGVLQFIAAVFMILTVAYLVWLSYAYRLFGKAWVLVLLLLCSTNGSLYYYGQWGLFDYSQKILISAFLLHMLLFLREKRLDVTRRCLALVSLAFCAVTVSYAAFVLPIAISIGVLYLSRRLCDAGDTRLSPRATLGNALILLMPVCLVGLATLKFYTHDQFLNPRKDIWWLFFPRSDHAQTVGGALDFLATTTAAFARSTFYAFWPGDGRSIWPPAPDAISDAVAIAFGVGLIRSLFEKSRNPTRFVIGAYVVGVVASLAGLGVAGVYAYGDIRYALFLHVPMLMVAVYGLTDVGGWLGKMASAVGNRILDPSIASCVRSVGMAVLAGFALVVSLGSANLVRTVKSRFSTEFGRAIEAVRADRSPLLIYDVYARLNLRGIGIGDFPDKRTFLFDSAFFAGARDQEAFLSRYRAFLARRQDVLWITYHRDDASPMFSAYRAALAETHVEDLDISINLWRITRWKGMNSPRDTDDPPTPPPVVTVEEAERLLPAYGKAMESMDAHPAMVIDTSVLPDSKARIKSAILAYVEVSRDAAQKELLKTAFVRLAWFQDGVGTTPVAVSVQSPDGRPWQEVVASEGEVLGAEWTDAGH